MTLYRAPWLSASTVKPSGSHDATTVPRFVYPQAHTTWAWTWIVMVAPGCADMTSYNVAHVNAVIGDARGLASIRGRLRSAPDDREPEDDEDDAHGTSLATSRANRTFDAPAGRLKSGHYPAVATPAATPIARARARWSRHRCRPHSRHCRDPRLLVYKFSGVLACPFTHVGFCRLRAPADRTGSSTRS